MQINGFKYCYKTLTILFNIHLFAHSEVASSNANAKSFNCTVKWFQLLLFNTNNSIQHYSSICKYKHMMNTIPYPLGIK